MTTLLNNRWRVAANQFAVRVVIPDVSGYFSSIPLLTGIPTSRSIVIEPGTRSAIIENGVLVGEIYAGEYTLERFAERLQFWKNRQATVYLTRSEDLAIECNLTGVPTQEGICVDVNSSWTLQLSHVVLFVENLFGPREILELKDVTTVLVPLLQQAVREYVEQSGYDHLISGQPSDLLHDAVVSRLKIKLMRVGFVVTSLQSATFVAQDGGLVARQGQLWLARRENELQRAAQAIDNEKVQSHAEDMRRKIDLRVKLRELVSEDRLNKIKSREDFANGLMEIDKDRLLRREERETLVRAYEERQADKASVREHFLALVELQREQEVDALRLSVSHASRILALEQELAQARLVRTADGERWQEELLRERERLTQRNEQRLIQHRAKWDRLRESLQNKREEELQSLLHTQQVEELQADLQFARAERQRQLAIFQAEMDGRLAHEKLEIQKRQDAWELERRGNRSAAQLDRLQRVQEMNTQYAERQQRLQFELEMLREEQTSQRELLRMQAMSSMSTEVLVATANESNAAALADLKKHEASQDAIKSQAAAIPEAALNAERLRLYEQLNATERAKADAVADAYRTALHAQQINVGQMIGGLAQAATPPAPWLVGQSPSAPMPFITGTPPPPGNLPESWYFAVDGQPSAAQTWQQLLLMAKTEQITGTTPVWKTGWSAWRPAAEVVELASILGAISPNLASTAPPQSP